MARPIRVKFADAVYLMTARGNQHKAIYRDDQDRQRFLETTEEVHDPFGVVSGMHQVVKRLEEKAKNDRALARRLRELTKMMSRAAPSPLPFL